MKNNRSFVIGDIHGGDRALTEVLQRAEITPEDRLIFLGDYVDGWSESSSVISHLISLQKTHDCIFIRGNHDALFQNWLATGEQNKLWLRNGGESTLQSYQGISQHIRKSHYRFLKNLQNYYIDEHHRLFVHGGFANMRGPNREYYDHVFYWDRTLWETAVATDKRLLPDNPRYPRRFTHFKEIFIGHTPTLHLGKTQPTRALNVWNSDTGAGFRGPLSILEINTKKVYQSRPVFQLYPEEKGRN